MSSCGTGYTAWVMPTAGAARRSRLIRTGSRSMSRVSARIGVGMVALKKSVCRLPGRWRRIFRMSGRKPMSSIRSASSSTRTSSPASRAYGWREVVEQAARRRDDDVHAAPEGVLLRPHADAAEHRRRR